MKTIFNTVNANIIRQVFFLLIILMIGWVILVELYFVFAGFLGAVTLYLILLDWMKNLVEVRKWPRWLAAVVLILLTLVVIIIPIVYLVSLFIERILPFIQDQTMITNSFNQINQYLVSNYQLDLLKEENVNKIVNEIINFGQSAINGTMAALGNIALMYIVVYFMFVSYKEIENWLKESLPLKRGNSDSLISEVKNLVVSNAVGIPIVATIQGLVGLAGYWMFDVEMYVIFSILTALCSVIPVVGTMIVYLPISIYLLATGDQWNGVAVLIYGLVVIGSVDNLARFLVQKKIADVHPLITLLGAIFGLNLFGFLGIIFGPLMLSLFFILVRIYHDEFAKNIINNDN